MTYILSDQRRSPEDVVANFKRYREYLTANQSRFPRQAYELATAEWYYDFNDHRCPHDSWLDSIIVSEPSTEPRSGSRTVAINVRLLGAYHDGHIELFYPKVFHYALHLDDGNQGHRDWRYDEIRLSKAGHLEHEVEWAGSGGTGRWLIEASDIIHTWQPKANSRIPAT